jgi:hypothetical protein
VTRNSFQAPQSAANSEADMHSSSTTPKVCILAGSPRKNGNTASLLRPFSEALEQHGAFQL